MHELRILQQNYQPKNERNSTMQHKFYDVKTKSHVTADVTEKVAYGQKGNERYAFRAKTADGRNLTAFVSKATWDKANIWFSAFF